MSLFREIWRSVSSRLSGAPKPTTPVEPQPPRKGNVAQLPPWQEWIQRDPDFWAEQRERAASGPKVLIANNVPGFYNSTAVESLLGAALTLRGADVHFLRCDRVLPGCLRLKYAKTKPPAVDSESFRDKICGPCESMAVGFTDLGLPVHQFSDWIDDETRAQCRSIAQDIPLEEIADFHRSFGDRPIGLGEQAYAGCLRYFATGNLRDQEGSEVVLRRYLEASLITAHVMDALTRAVPFDRATFHHGIYVPQGVVSEFLRAREIPLSTWNVAYRKQCFIFSHDDTYHHTLMDEPASTWADMPFTDEHERQIDEYLQSRWHGSQDWIYFHDTPDPALETLVAETGLDPKKPIIGMLTNVMWDAQLHYRANAFPDMLTWILATIRSFAKREDVQLLIRVHPAELRGTQKSRQLVVEEIAREFPTLPSNVFVLGPESNVNTYAAMERCNSVIIYGTKTGVELTSRGIPVIVAGEAWIRNKGITTDVSSAEEYESILAKLPLAEERLSDDQVRRAKMYAYHFFFRRMVPVDAIEPIEDGKVPFRVALRSLRDLLPGNDRGLDVICDGILERTPFVYPAELESSDLNASCS